jgi:hypothetical protein
MRCSYPSCNHTYRAGYRLYRTADGWRCAEHAGPPGLPLHRALSAKEAKADAERRKMDYVPSAEHAR